MSFEPVESSSLLPFRLPSSVHIGSTPEKSSMAMRSGSAFWMKASTWKSVTVLPQFCTRTSTSLSPEAYLTPFSRSTQCSSARHGSNRLFTVSWNLISSFRSSMLVKPDGLVSSVLT